MSYQVIGLRSPGSIYIAKQHLLFISHRLPLFYNSEIGNWCMMLPSCDEPVVRRTQHFNYHLRRERPVS